MNVDEITHIIKSRMDGLARTMCAIYVNWNRTTDNVNESNCSFCINGEINPVLLGVL